MNELKTIDIKGKKYVEVNERIKYFREHFKGYALLSDVIELTDKRCVIKATVLNAEGKEVATGFAYEMEGNSFINKTSYIENCETSAWGRALGNFGIGIDSSVASFEEVANAVKNQLKPPTKIAKDEYELILKDVIEKEGVNSKTNATYKQYVAETDKGKFRTFSSTDGELLLKAFCNKEKIKVKADKTTYGYQIKEVL